jgi:hypothetical protein
VLEGRLKEEAGAGIQDRAAHDRQLALKAERERLEEDRRAFERHRDAVNRDQETRDLELQVIGDTFSKHKFLVFSPNGSTTRSSLFFLIVLLSCLSKLTCYLFVLSSSSSCRPSKPQWIGSLISRPAGFRTLRLRVRLTQRGLLGLKGMRRGCGTRRGRGMRRPRGGEAVRPSR